MAATPAAGSAPDPTRNPTSSLRQRSDRFDDRQDAARQLARCLQGYAGQRPVVLAIPRGAVAMAAGMAQALGGEFDVVLVRKLRAPWQPELAVGAVDESGWVYLPDDGHRQGLTDEDLASERRAQLAVLRERRRRYGPLRPGLQLADRVVIVVDDGMATGATMMAALHAVRQSGPSRLVCAVPVASPEAVRRVAACADEVVCLRQPAGFEAVGHHYRDFSQVTDEEVMRLLGRRQSGIGSAPAFVNP